MKIELKNLNELEDLTHEKGIIVEKKYHFHYTVKSKKDKELKKIKRVKQKNKILEKRKNKSIKILNNIKYVFENNLIKRKLSKKTFVKNIPYFVSNIKIENMSDEDFRQLIELVSKLPNSKEVIESIMDNFDTVLMDKKIDIDIFLKKLYYILLKINSNKEIDISYYILFTEMIKPEDFEKLENMVFEKMIENKEVDYDTAYNLFELTLNKIKIENLKKICLNIKVFKNYSGVVYENLIKKYLNKDIEKELRDLIIDKLVESKIFLEILYYVCLIRNIENNIDLKKININTIIKRLITTNNQLSNINVENLNMLLKVYLEESENIKEYIKRCENIKELFENKLSLKERILFNQELLNF